MLWLKAAWFVTFLILNPQGREMMKGVGFKQANLFTEKRKTDSVFLAGWGRLLHFLQTSLPWHVSGDTDCEVQECAWETLWAETADLGPKRLQHTQVELAGQDFFHQKFIHCISSMLLCDVWLAQVGRLILKELKRTWNLRSI